MKEKSLIRRAIKVLEKLRWIKGTWFLQNGKTVQYGKCLEADSCCLDGALIIAKRGGHYSQENYVRAKELIKQQASNKFNKPIHVAWQINDQYCNSKEDVIEILKESLND